MTLEVDIIEDSAKEEENVRLITQINYSRSRTSEEENSNNSDNIIQKKR